MLSPRNIPMWSFITGISLKSRSGSSSLVPAPEASYTPDRAAHQARALLRLRLLAFPELWFQHQFSFLDWFLLSRLAVSFSNQQSALWSVFFGVEGRLVLLGSRAIGDHVGSVPWASEDSWGRLSSADLLLPTRDSHGSIRCQAFFHFQLHNSGVQLPNLILEHYLTLQQRWES